MYDTERGLWQEESAAGTGMVSTGQQLYLWDGSALWAADPEREAGGEDETGLKFEAVTGDIGLAVPDDKYISRVTLRMDALAHTVLTVAVSYDGGDWETVSSCAVTKDHQRVNLPFVPRRHDTMRLKICRHRADGAAEHGLYVCGCSGGAGERRGAEKMKGEEMASIAGLAGIGLPQFSARCRRQTRRR